MKRARIIVTVTGHVQGIFFRAQTRERAQNLGLTGYAENLSSGGVRIVAEGPTDRLYELVLWCRRGPEFASIERVEVKWHKPNDAFTDFAIR